GRAGSPGDYPLVAAHFRFMKAANQGRQNVRIVQIEIVAGTVQIGRHEANRVESELTAVRLTQLDPCDLGYRVPFVGGLQWASEKVLFLDWLWGKPRIDTARAEKDELCRTGALRRIDDIRSEEHTSELQSLAY